jgi:hypothetical protein
VFEGFVAVRSPRVEGGVGVVYEAEEHGQSFFQVLEGEGMLGVGHLISLWWGVGWPPIYL